MSAVIDGVGPDAPTVTNAAGGKQSHSPYRCDLLPPRAALSVAKVLKHGADKYGADNWRAIPIPDHINHAMTHLFAWQAGDASDEHLEHAACRLLFALDLHSIAAEQTQCTPVAPHPVTPLPPELSYLADDPYAGARPERPELVCGHCGEHAKDHRRTPGTYRYRTLCSGDIVRL